MSYEFGEKIRQSDFLLDADTVHINHGSWGTVPKRVFNHRVRLMTELETSPDHWFRRTLEERWMKNLAAAADFLGAEAEDVVFVVNATSGVNSVSKSVDLGPGDAILVQSYTYNAIHKTAQAAADKAGCEVLTVVIPLEITDPIHIVQRYEEVFSKTQLKIKLVILDYISSATAVLFPIEKLVPVCKSHNALVMLDAAHTPGQLPVNLKELSQLGIDFYTGNLHKWVYAPRGCAILWIHPKHQKSIHPAVTSHCYKDPKLQRNYFLQGTRDDTPFLCAKEAVTFYKDIGGFAAIQSYCKELLDKAVDMLVSSWGTCKQPIPRDMEAPFMRLVQLPTLKQFPIPDETAIFCDMTSLMTLMYTRFKICCTILGVYGKVWVRVSANVYNHMEDYKKLCDAVLVLKHESDQMSLKGDQPAS